MNQCACCGVVPIQPIIVAFPAALLVIKLCELCALRIASDITHIAATARRERGGGFMG